MASELRLNRRSVEAPPVTAHCADLSCELITCIRALQEQTWKGMGLNSNSKGALSCFDLEHSA